MGGVQVADPAEIRALLQRILASRHFRAARNLSAFLRYVVETTLAGRGDEIKEYSIGVEALGRGPDFDPKADGVVRVHAAQLRKKLAAYYADEGRHEGLRIEVPRGGYVPHVHSAPPPPEPPGDQPRRRRLWPALAGVGALGLAFAAGQLLAGRDAALTVLPQPELTRAPPALWLPLLADDVPVILAVGVPQFFSGAGLLVRDIGINRAEDRGQSEKLNAIERLLGEPLRPTEVYTGIGETIGAATLAEFFAAQGKPLTVQRSRLVRWEDVRDAHVVFLSSMRFRTLADELGIPVRFALDEHGNVVNRAPAPGEALIHRRTEASDLALVTFAEGKRPGRKVLLLEGVGTWGTQAAAEYVTGRDSQRALLARVAPEGKMPVAFQVLLRVEIRDDQPVAVSYLTHHLLAEAGPPR